MTQLAADTQELPQALYKVEEAARVLRLSRAELYEQMAAGRLRSVKVGRARRIPAQAISEFVALLEQETEVSA